MRLSDNITKNLEAISKHVKDAHKRRISILCFPECALSGYIVNHKETKFKDIRDAISLLQNTSNELDMSLLVGTPWVSNKRIYNSAVIIRPHQIIKMYYKNDLTDYDKKYFSKGNCTVSFNINGIKCGVLICRDQNNPFLALKYKNARILFFLSSHYYNKDEAKKKERKNKAFPIVRALENKTYVAKADAVGEQNGLISIGSTMVVNDKGYVIAEAQRYKEEVLKFNI